MRRRVTITSRSIARSSDEGEVESITMLKSLWASIQGDPVFMRRVNGWLALFWIAMIPLSYFMGWLNSVVYVSALSLWALVSGHWSAWQAARVEVAQQEQQEEQQKQDLPGQVAERIVQTTTLKPANRPD